MKTLLNRAGNNHPKSPWAPYRALVQNKKEKSEIKEEDFRRAMIAKTKLKEIEAELDELQKQLVSVSLNRNTGCDCKGYGRAAHSVPVLDRCSEIPECPFWTWNKTRNFEQDMKLFKIKLSVQPPGDTSLSSIHLFFCRTQRKEYLLQRELFDFAVLEPECSEIG